MFVMGGVPLLLWLCRYFFWCHDWLIEQSSALKVYICAVDERLSFFFFGFSMCTLFPIYYTICWIFVWPVNSALVLYRRFIIGGSPPHCNSMMQYYFVPWTPKVYCFVLCTRFNTCYELLQNRFMWFCLRFTLYNVNSYLLLLKIGNLIKKTV